MSKERKEPDSSGVEMHDVAAAASAGTVHGAAPAPSPAETLVDLSDDVPAAPFENQYHHNAARQDKIANPTEREIQQLLTKVGTAAACTALREGAAERISLNVRGLTDADCVSLGHLLKVPNRLSALTTLSLSNNAIGDLGARALGDALASPGGAPLLTRLALHENAIGDDGLAALAASFTPSGAPKLQHLRLSFNRIGDAGLHALSSAWAAGGARELRELHLAANNIGDAGATAIAEQLHHVLVDYTGVWNLRWRQSHSRSRRFRPCPRASCKRRPPALHIATQQPAHHTRDGRDPAIDSRRRRRPPPLSVRRTDHRRSRGSPRRTNSGGGGSYPHSIRQQRARRYFIPRVFDSPKRCSEP